MGLIVTFRLILMHGYIVTLFAFPERMFANLTFMENVPVETAQLKWQSKWVLTLLNSVYC
jgi:hypothetical protein